MIWNNLKIALRNIRKNKLFAAINILGLALGLSIYVFGGLLVKYERTHDAFFANSDRIYTISSELAADLDVGVDSLNTAHSAIGPIIEAELPDVDAVARTIGNEFLVSSGDKSFYQQLRFADPSFLEIFDLQFIHGDENSLSDPSGIIISETAAIKYFGNIDVIGKVLTFDNEYDFQVAGIFADVPRNSHFNSLPVTEVSFDMMAPIKALVRMREFDEAGGYNNLSMGNMTYVMLPEDGKASVQSIFPVPLLHANLAIWDTMGLPIVTVVQLLSFLVLVVACVNYTNLATAQALRRSREVGMRKTMGATQKQLLVQFLVESIVIAAIAMVVAIAALEVVVPLFNNVSNKILTLGYVETLPWLAATTLLVGLVAGLYPAWLITRASPIDALRDVARKGKSGSRVRSFMIGAQFAISAFMLALVSIVYMQNQKIEEGSYIFPRAEIYGLSRLNVDLIQERLDTLRHEIEAIPNVDSVAWSSQVPFEQTNSSSTVSARPGDEAGEFNINWMRMSPEFLATYDIELVAGRNLDRDLGSDLLVSDEETEVVNVLVNELTLVSLGIASPAEAINRSIYIQEEEDDDSVLRELVIVGVVPTQNILGLFNAEKPWVFAYWPETFRVGSIRITGGNMLTTIDEVEQVWDRVIPEYPIQGRFLDDVFDDVYNILKFMNLALAGFAFVALALALIGLFGLAAFMAAQRTKEIGVRKVLGASSAQIARLLVLQFSKPVAWALAVALPLAYIASSLYLNFFADRINSAIPILLVSGAVAVLLAWGTVAGHAIKIARSNPVVALRYE
jgi:putative ABC transport system permease protein